MTKVLLFGASGMLAHDVIAEAPVDATLIACTRHDVDVTDPDAVHETLATIVPDIVINCAAYTDVDGAEADRDAAFAVNGRAPGIIADAAARAVNKPFVIHYGTDYVFDGTASRGYRESDPVAPLGVYGTSKLAGESAMARHDANYVIVRTQWLYGVHGRSFPRTMWERATQELSTKVVDDQVGCPTFTVDVARATWQVIGLEQLHGSDQWRAHAPDRLMHMTNSGSATWYDVAHRVFDRVGQSGLLTPCTTADFPRPAPRPTWSVLDTTRLNAIIGSALPTWENALDRFLDDLQESSP